jgi:murein tripeptide amidase MpaA
VVTTRAAAASLTAVAPTAVATVRVGTSRGGRAITAVRLGPNSARRRLVVVGVIHGTETAGARVVARLRAIALPAGLAVWLVPSMNPDGLAAGRRTNGALVDLNRNFPQVWRRAGQGGPNFSGPRAASEPETRALMQFLTAVNPGLVVIFHQPLNGVDSYGAKSLSTVRALAAAMRFQVGWFDCRGGCHGTLTQWFNHAHPGQAITVEFPSGRPSSARVDRVARGLLAVAASSRVAATPVS